jgi:1-acyl-sn-glycerol-3-phosphate acyltransferase
VSAWRAGGILASFLVLTVPLMPVQALFVRFAPSFARKFPHWYHRQVCRLIGVKLDIEGAVERGKPVLLVANHTSWIDIPVLSAVAPLSFIAKKEVGRWPFVSSLARLQRTVFVDRERRTAVGETTSEIAARLRDGDTVVLFAEGTSSDGSTVLPFKTSLFAAVKPPGKAGAADAGTAIAGDAVVQTISLSYTRLHGLPIGRGDRPLVGWYGDMEMQSHAWALLKAGPLDARIRIGPPVPLADFANRKDLALRSENEIRANVVQFARGRAESVQPTRPPENVARVARTTQARQPPGKWV